MTPYQYCGNNPIMFIDPSGMNHKDYKINEDGSFTKLNDNSTPDRVFNNKGEFVELEYDGQIEASKTLSGTTFSEFSNRAKAKEAFEFFASNSNIEWGQVNTPTNSYILKGDASSVNATGFTYSYLLSRNKDVDEIIHSHPTHVWGSEAPSGYGHNPTKNNMYSEPNPYREPDGDYRGVKMLIDGFSINGTEYKGFGDKARNIKHKVFNPVEKTYIEYDEKKAIKILK